jgi:MFS family permease
MRKLHYGWVIVAVCALMMGITYGLMYSYSVFFKPLADYFNWDRATVSGVYSASLVIRGAVSIAIGWLADKYGAKKLMAFCGFMIGLGLILSSQINTLWQFYITYALIQAIGLSGTFGIATALTSRWFYRNRGLALGIVSTGSGLGTLLIVPGAERLINATDWSMAFIIIGATAGLIMLSTAFLLKPSPQENRNIESAGEKGTIADQAHREATNSLQKSQNPPVLSLNKERAEAANISNGDVSLKTAIRNPKMILLIAIFALVFFCVQLVMAHLVNYATDIGITPLVAASFISIIGVVGIGGRLAMGIGSDRLGIHNTFIICGTLLAISLASLIFTRALWSFYLFAVIFGFAYGGEVPQIPLFLGSFFGTRSLAALTGLLLFASNIGGALGPWLSGRIFDTTGSYQLAFIIAASAGLVVLIGALILKKYSRSSQEKKELGVQSTR